MTGERLNGAAPPLLEIDYLVSSGNVSSISFPEPGCWTLDIEAGTASLKATVYVYPVACRQLSGNGTATATPAEPVSACVPPV